MKHSIKAIIKHNKTSKKKTSKNKTPKNKTSKNKTRVGALIDNHLIIEEDTITIDDKTLEHLQVDKNTLVKVTIPSTVKSIGKSAFEGCIALVEVTIPSSVTSIGDGAFKHCSALAEVTIPTSVESIGEFAFATCSALVDVSIPNSVKNIEVNAFAECSALKKVTIPNSVELIGKYAFSDCSALKKVTIPNSVKEIDEGVFTGCSSLVEVTIPDSVENIGKDAFSHCNALVEMTIPTSVGLIGNNAFFECRALKKVTIPDSVKKIGEGAFSKCSALVKVTIPNSVNLVGKYAFDGCTALKNVTHSAWTKIKKPAFDKCSKELKIYIITPEKSMLSIKTKKINNKKTNIINTSNISLHSSLNNLEYEKYNYQFCYLLNLCVLQNKYKNFVGLVNPTISNTTNPYKKNYINTIINNELGVGIYFYENKFFYIGEETHTNFINLLRELEKRIERFIVILIRSYNHANIIILDTNSKKGYYFEPHGKKLDFLNKEKQKELKDLFTTEGYDFFFPDQYYAVTNGFQYMDVYHKNNKKSGKSNGLDADGYCFYWCMYFLNMIIKHEDISVKNVFKNVFINILKSKKKDFHRHIRTYSQRQEKAIRELYPQYIDIDFGTNNSISYTLKKNMFIEYYKVFDYNYS